METQTKIALLNELGHMGDQLKVLNSKVKYLRLMCESAVTRGWSVEKRKPRVTRWVNSIQHLRDEYNKTVEFSQKHNLVVLPVPRELTQTP